MTSQVASRAADSATRAFANCDSLSAGVTLSKWHLEREREREGERDAKSLSDPSAEYSESIAGRDETMLFRQ